MLKDFNGNTFYPHGIIPSLPVGIGGNTVFVEVEIVHAPLDYNLLLEPYVLLIHHISGYFGDN